MTRILFRAGRPPHSTLSNEAAFGWRLAGTYGSNTGNMLFSDSVYRAVNTPDADITCDAYAPEWHVAPAASAARVNDEFDHYVVPLANAFRRNFGENHLPRLTNFIEQLEIPVTVVGVGAQLPLSGKVSDMDPAVRENTVAFTKAVLKRSASMGVRGEITKRALLDLGFADDEIDIIGCPSLYVEGRDLAINKQTTLGPDAKVSMNLESNVRGLAEIYRANEKANPGLLSVYQTLPAAELIMWGKTANGFPQGVPRSATDAAYREGRMRFFTSSQRWREFMGELDFAFGIRIHGNVSALSAETPAFMLTIDSRTRELSEYHAIPNATLSSVFDSGKYLASDLYERADFTEFNHRAGENFDRYVSFLDRNNVPHIHSPGQENPDYAAEVASAPFPEGARPLNVSDQDEMLRRMQWLWQGREADRHRKDNGYLPDFFMDRTSTLTSEATAELALSQARATAAELAALKKRLAATPGARLVPALRSVAGRARRNAKRVLSSKREG